MRSPPICRELGRGLAERLASACETGRGDDDAAALVAALPAAKVRMKRSALKERRRRSPSAGEIEVPERRKEGDREAFE